MNVKEVLGRSYKGQPIPSSAVLMEKLLEEAGLVCLNGERFGAPGYLRFSYGVEESLLEKAISRFSGFISELT